MWGFLDVVQGRTQIGKDQAGNTFWEVSNPGGKPDPKREVDYVEKQMEEIEWHHISPEWRLWLRYARTTPPSEEEIRKGDAQRAYTLARAIEIEKEDQRQRSLEMAKGAHRREPSEQGQAARIAYIADRVHGRASGAPAPRPQPSTHEPSSEGTGRGGSFKPGTWDPNA